MQASPITQVVVCGGGTAGWMTAAALSKILQSQVQITLVESDEIGIVGVGEATIPMIRRFNQALEIDEDDFLKATNGSYKLAIEFVNWGRKGDRYMHGFGRFGPDFWAVPFDQYWQKQYQAGKARDLGDYMITRVASSRNKFLRAQPQLEGSPLADVHSAFHFDASLYARYLRGYAEKRGVRRIEGKVLRAEQRGKGQHPEHIAALVMEDGTRVEGQLFVDCSGFRGLLIEQMLKTGYDNWSNFLPCDRALAVPCESVSPLTPYTRSTAHQAGWQWRIPLQHRTGNGHVYCSRYISDDEAAAVLLKHLDGQPLADPRPLKFVTGMRKKVWNQNVVAIGLASGFMEPLESTSIHLIQTAIQRLVDFFPSSAFEAADIEEFNKQARWEWERIRDFIVLHYHLNQRDDSAFWKDCAAMAVPATLKHRIALYESQGRIVRDGNELFAEVGWLQVLHGQNARARGYHPLVDLVAESDIQAYLDNVHTVVGKCVDVMPDHAVFLADNCAAVR
jgi:tryptophan halogenase